MVTSFYAITENFIVPSVTTTKQLIVQSSFIYEMFKFQLHL